MYNYFLTLGLIIIVLCWTEVWVETGSVQEAAGIHDVQISCFTETDRVQTITSSDGLFWMINGLVYGLLQVPQEFVVCSLEFDCDLEDLTILTVQTEIDGHIFQCFSIDYHNNTVHLGGLTVLTVVTVTFTIPGRPIDHGVFELDYTQFSVGPATTSIGWTYSNLTCEPAVFIIEGYDDRNPILADNLATPVLTLNSTSTLVLFPTSYITNSSLYLRLLAYDVSGTACAQDSTNRYYQLNDNVTPVPIYKSPDGIACIPIPVEVSSTHDYSSLEILWPEKHNSPGRLCYCPPFEGEYHLFSRCISTTSCDTDYSITVRNNSVCFTGLSDSHELANIPVYFTLLDSCIDHRCIIRSVVTSFIVHMLAPPPPPVVNFTNTSMCFWSTSPVEYYLVNVTDVSVNNTSLSTYNTSQCLNITSELYSNDSTCMMFTVSVAAVNRAGTSCRTHLICLQVNNTSETTQNSAITTKDTTNTMVTRLTTSTITTQRGPETIILIAVISAISIILLLSLPPTVFCLCRQARKHKYHLDPSQGERYSDAQTNSVYEVITDENIQAMNEIQTEELYSSINNINPALPPLQTSMAQRVYDVIKNESIQIRNEDETHRAYDIITHENLPPPQPTDEPNEPTYNTLQYRITTRPKKNEKDTHPLQSDADASTKIEGAYEIITSVNAGVHVYATDKPKTALYSTLDKGTMSTSESLGASSSKAEGIGGLHKAALYSTLDKGNMSNSENLGASLSKADEGIGGLHKEALYSTVDKKINNCMTTAESLNANLTDSEVISDATDKSCKAAVYSTVDKTKRRDIHYHMITAESLNADSTEVNDSTEKAVYSTVDKNDHNITAGSLNADSAEVNSDVIDKPCKEAMYSTVDKTKRNRNYFMITAGNFDSDCCEAGNTSELIPEWGDRENMTASQNTTTILDVSHTVPKCTKTSAVEGKCEAIGIKTSSFKPTVETNIHSSVPTANPEGQHPPISPKCACSF